MGDGVSWASVTVYLLFDDFPKVEFDSGITVKTLLKVAFFLLWGTLLVFLRWMWMSIFFQKQPRLFSKQKQLSGEKQVAISPNGICSIESLKKLGKNGHGHATVNDVVLAAIAKGMQAFTDEEDCGLAIAVPVNIRLSNLHVLELKNIFGSMSLFLPMGKRGDSFQKTLQNVAKETRIAKMLPEAFVGFFLLMLTNMLLPVSWARNLFDFLASKISASISNVKGQEKQIHFKGVLCEGMIGIVPPPNGVPLGIAIISYGPDLYLSIATDRAGN
jgi:hypothetical protein